MSAVALDQEVQAARTIAPAAAPSAPDMLALPSVPMSYAVVALDYAAEKGFDRAHVAEGCGFEPALLDDPHARLTTHQSTALMARVQALTGVAALGYELGMRTSFTAHGMLGFGVMSSTNLMEAIDIGLKYFRLRNVTFGLQWQVVDDCVELEIQDFAPHAPMRRTATEWLLIALGRTGTSLLSSGMPSAQQSAEQSTFCFPWPEPDYHARYRAWLPNCRFNAPVAALRFPLQWLLQRLPSAAPASVQLATGLCDKELPLVKAGADTAERIRKMLGTCDLQYPALDDVAQRLHVSASTLKRRLLQEGFSFSELLDEARGRDATHLLEFSHLSVADIAMKLGYQNTANFTRAFRKWTQCTPSAWRARVRQASTAVRA